jgi:hypothetical protein
MLNAPARKVARVTQYLRAQNEYEHELIEEQRKKQEEAERKAKSNANSRR